MSSPIRNLDTVFESLVQRQRSFLQPLRQRLPLEVLHDDEIHAVLLADVVEGTDVRMVQLRNGLRLALEAGLALRTLGEVLGEEL